MIRATIATLLAIAIAPYAQAQVKCTMPNGVVITQQLGGCPNGAIKARAADGSEIALPPPKSPSPTPQSAAAPQPRPAPAPLAPPAPTQRRTEPSAYEYAQVICKAFEQVGATTCDINSNILSDSTIETTLAISPGNAALTCKDVAASMRAKTNAFDNKNWKILIFSPFSGNRPIAACRL